LLVEKMKRKSREVRSVLLEIDDMTFLARSGLSRALFNGIVEKVNETQSMVPSHFFDALLMCRHNFTWEAAAGFAVDGYVDPRTLQTRFKTVANQIAASTLVDPTVRYNSADVRFPLVTAILDGTPIPCRAQFSSTDTELFGNRVATFSGKRKFKCWNVELWSTVCGIPLGFRGPMEGSQHDATLFQGLPPPFPHRIGELFIADSGYMGLDHCLVPFKEGEREDYGGEEVVNRGDGPTTIRATWNVFHRQLRSRIERTNSWMTKYRFFLHTERDKEWVKNALTIVIAVEYYNRLRMPNPYTVPGHLDPQSEQQRMYWSCDWVNNPICTCGLTDKTTVENCKMARPRLCKRLLDLNYFPAPLPPRKNREKRSRANSRENSESAGEEIFIDPSYVVVPMMNIVEDGVNLHLAAFDFLDENPL
jgi:hypothetical protein